MRTLGEVQEVQLKDCALHVVHGEEQGGQIEVKAS